MICAEERYKKILDLLKEQEYISTNELIEKLDMSRETIRRDLNSLAKRGALIKTHGGATSKESSVALYDTPVILREATNVSLKKEVCKYAAQFIEDRDNIFIDNSSTAAHLINYIPKNYHITLITYSTKLLLEIAKLRAFNWNVISLGGVFNLNTLSTGNFLTMNNLSIFKPTKAFMSCHGINQNFEVTDSYINDIEIKRFLIQNSQETFLLADHSKLPRKGVMLIDDATAFSHIVVDNTSDKDFVDKLTRHGCDIMIAESISRK